MRKFFSVMAALEVVTGVVLVMSPSMLVWLLLGSALDAPAAIIIARIGGVALIALGTACGFSARDENSAAAAGLMSAMLVYNSGTAALLAYAGTGPGLSGIGLWPAVLVHAALATGCIAVVKFGVQAQY